MIKRSDEIFDFTFNEDLSDVTGLSVHLGHEGRGRGPRIALDDVEVELTVVDGAVTEVLGWRPDHRGWIDSILFEDSDHDGLFGAVVIGQVATPEARGLKLQPFVIGDDGSVSRLDDGDDDSSDDGSSGTGGGSSGGGAKGRTADDDRGGNGRPADPPGAPQRPERPEPPERPEAPERPQRPDHPTGGDDGPGHRLLSVELDGTTYVVDFKSRPFWADVELYRDDNGDGTWTRVATFAGPEVADWFDPEAGTVDLTGIADLLLASDGLVG